MTIFSEDCQLSRLPNSIFALHFLIIQNIITMLLQQHDCKWKVSYTYYKNTMDTVYQAQCQSWTHEAQCIQWPPDMSDLILTLSSVPMARIYCPTIYIFHFDWKWNVWKIKFGCCLFFFFKELMHFQDWQSLFVFHRKVAKNEKKLTCKNISDKIIWPVLVLSKLHWPVF